MFKGKAILVSGASSGLGATLALEFAREGACLGLFALDEAGLQEVRTGCDKLGVQTVTIAGDVSNPVDCERAVKATVDKFGTLDHLVLCAGISMWTRFDEVQDLSLFKRLIDTNYLGAVNCTYYALPYLRRNHGTIVAISSIQGKIGVPLHTGYVASKHALQGFFDALRTEIDESELHILLVLPHWLRGTNLRKSAIGSDGQSLGTGSAGHNRESISLEECSQAIMQAMQGRRRELIIPFKLRFLPWVKLIAPRLLESIVRGKVKQQK